MPHPERPASRLVLWNVDHTLLDAGRVTREAYAEAFTEVTGKPMVRLAPTAGRTESEIIFETLAFNGIVTDDDHLDAFTAALERAFAVRRDKVRAHARVLPGAVEALAAAARLPGAVQSVLTGSLEGTARIKLAELGLDRHLDLSVGGYFSPVYPKGATIETSRIKAAAAYQTTIAEAATVLVADHPLDVRAAQIARARSVGVATGTATETELRAAGADAVLPTLADTRAILETIDRLTR
ncbi:haloacid dehalogenase-like hydrolase [Actinocorallia sp. API 0066]|uniref:HAD family hydrolase n=1 Tax=Actinocorallia sp. API 0066 TaxID=2896846 RepID=UPI001E456BB2|nr:haloacid dehalogenase-like hydrolase [Actinocorallia sp. API 0066]MCD0451237.1 haloacid dehalogenase-like hydrolase [Actinocorallia sp. API 0066]